MSVTVLSKNRILIRLTEERWAHIMEEHGELRGMQTAILATVAEPDLIFYDQEADVLYVNFKKPSVATDSELTDDDVIIRYQDDEIIGFTVLHASQRQSNSTAYQPS